jgi:hypothetical protein
LVFNEALWTLLRGGRVKVNESTGEAVVDLVDDLSDFGLPEVQAVVAAGAEVHHYPIWVELDTTTIKDTVPAGTPGGTDSKGDPVTWEQWAKDTAITDDGDKRYVGGQSGTGVDLTGSEIVALIGKGVAVKTLPEMQAIVAAKQSVIPVEPVVEPVVEPAVK